MDTLELLKNNIRSIPDYPKKGILFKDIIPMLKNPEAFKMCIEELAKQLQGKKIDYIVGIEARGFILGSALAYKLGVGFIPIRKAGKLPYERVSKEYALEYGTATIEIHNDAITKGNNIVIIDDLLATGGTAGAAEYLVESMGGNVTAMAFVIELSDLNGRSKLKSKNIISIIRY